MYVGPTYQIGDHEFLSLSFPSPVKERPLAMDRPGVTGSAIWLTGERGKPFTVRSTCDAYHLNHAIELFLEYRTLIGQDPVDLIWNDYHVTDENTKVAVLDVRRVPDRIFRMAGATQGLNPPSLGWIEADWELLLLPVS